jgi:hypothetical protein
LVRAGQHGASQIVHHLGDDRPQQQTPEGTVPFGGHDDQISVFSLRHLFDDDRRVAILHPGRMRDAPALTAGKFLQKLLPLLTKLLQFRGYTRKSREARFHNPVEAAAAPRNPAPG